MKPGSAWYGVKAPVSLRDRLILLTPPGDVGCAYMLGCGRDAVGWSRAKINGVLVPACTVHEGRR